MSVGRNNSNKTACWALGKDRKTKGSRMAPLAISSFVGNGHLASQSRDGQSQYITSNQTSTDFWDRKMTCYLIRAGETDKVKIGHTGEDTTVKRCRALQAAHWETLHLLRTWRGEKKAENWLHHRFSAYHITRDWFIFTKEMMTVEIPENIVSAPPIRSKILGHTPTTSTGLKAVLSIKGMTTYKLAAALGITQGAVCQWDKIPMARVERIHQVTGIPRHVLRPDMYPAQISDAAIATNLEAIKLAGAQLTKALAGLGQSDGKANGLINAV